MEKIFTVDTFNFVNPLSIPCPGTTDEAMNNTFARISKWVTKGQVYSICRIVYDHLRLIKMLKNENAQLRKEIMQLKELQEQRIDRSKTSEKTYVSSRFEPWIDNGQPGAFPEPNDGWMH